MKEKIPKEEKNCGQIREAKGRKNRYAHEKNERIPNRGEKPFV